MDLKKKMALALAGVMAIGLTACGGAQETTRDTVAAGDATAVQSDLDAASGDEKRESGDRITLRMAWWGSQTRHDATIKVVELYEAANPNVDIEVEYYDFDGYFTKLNTLVASNTVWDIFQLGGNYPKYEDKIVPLDDYIAKGVIDTSDTTEGFLATTRGNEGKQWGLSIGTNTYGIAYDPEMFAEAGVPEPSDNWTWDDWKQAALTIHEKLDIYGSSKMDHFIAGVTCRISQTEAGANFFDPSGTKLGTDNQETVAEYLSMIKELTDAGAYPDAGAINEIKDIEGDYLVTGDAAMTWVSSNQINAIVNAAGREIRIAPIPRIDKDGAYGMCVQSSQMLSVSKDSAHPDEAAKFINYFVNDVEANKVLNGERGVPIMGKVREVVESQADGSTKLIYDFVDKIGSYPDEGCNVISPEPKTEIEDNYKLLVEKVEYGELTPEEAAGQLFEFANSKFN